MRNEVSAFPNVKHDDQTDAMVYALRDLQAPSAAERARGLARWGDEPTSEPRAPNAPSTRDVLRAQYLGRWRSRR